MSKFTKDIGNRIYQARITNKLTQEQLALKTRISDNTISLIENGNINTGFVNLFKICRALNIKLADLFKGY